MAFSMRYDHGIPMGGEVFVAGRWNVSLLVATQRFRGFEERPGPERKDRDSLLLLSARGLSIAFDPKEGISGWLIILGAPVPHLEREPYLRPSADGVQFFSE